MVIKSVIYLILCYISLTNINFQEKSILSIHKERIKQIIHTVNTIDKPNINNFLDLFFINSELEKYLFIKKKTFEGMKEERADSLFDWVVMQNREKNESLVLNRLKNYLSPVSSFNVGQVFESNDSYAIYEVFITLKSNENKKNKYYFGIGKISEEKYSIIDIYDNNLISIITGKPKGYCYWKS